MRWARVKLFCWSHATVEFNSSFLQMKLGFYWNCPHRKNIISLPQASPRSNNSLGEWTCSRCSFVNAAERPGCEMCSTPPGPSQSPPLRANSVRLKLGFPSQERSLINSFLTGHGKDGESSTSDHEAATNVGPSWKCKREMKGIFKHS